MAVIEKDGLYQYIDEYGNIYILYPVTKLDNVSGTGKLVHLENGTTLKTLDGTNIAFVTADDIKNFVTSSDLEALSNTANAADRVKYESGVLKTLGGTEIVTGNAKIATGSYVGTGTFGAENPTTLNLDFEPSLVFIKAKGVNWFYIIYALVLSNAYSSFGYARNYSANNTDMAKKSADGKTVSWYTKESGNSGVQQANAIDTEYEYIAIG